MKPHYFFLNLYLCHLPPSYSFLLKITSLEKDMKHVFSDVMDGGLTSDKILRQKNRWSKEMFSGPQCLVIDESMFEERSLHLQVSRCLSNPPSLHQLRSHPRSLVKIKVKPRMLKWVHISHIPLQKTLPISWKCLPNKPILIEFKPLRSVILSGPPFCSITLSVCLITLCSTLKKPHQFLTQTQIRTGGSPCIYPAFHQSLSRWGHLLEVYLLELHRSPKWKYACFRFFLATLGCLALSLSTAH